MKDLLAEHGRMIWHAVLTSLGIVAGAACDGSAGDFDR
jgi:hypothetical protein